MKKADVKVIREWLAKETSGMDLERIEKILNGEAKVESEEDMLGVAFMEVMGYFMTKYVMQ